LATGGENFHAPAAHRRLPLSPGTPLAERARLPQPRRIALQFRFRRPSSDPLSDAENADVGSKRTASERIRDSREKSMLAPVRVIGN